MLNHFNSNIIHNIILKTNSNIIEETTTTVDANVMNHTNAPEAATTKLKVASISMRTI